MVLLLLAPRASHYSVNSPASSHARSGQIHLAQHYSEGFCSWREHTFRDLAERDWESVKNVISRAVSGSSRLDEYSSGALLLPPHLPDWKDTRTTWALKVAYFGPSFSAFAWQADDPLDTVMGCIERAIQPLLGNRRPRLASAGRTDSGVSALGQVVTFSTFEDLSSTDLRSAIDAIRPVPRYLLSALA
ncbi:MAG: hypothetical protein SGPRY_006221 [Prymnesium sp.]